MTRPMQLKRVLLPCALLGLVSLPAQAHAESAENAWDGGYKQVSTRRSGFMLGLDLGVALGNGTGFPNEVAKLDDPAYRRNSGFGLGVSNRVWFGGALSDWFVFGIGLNAMQLKHNDVTLKASAFIFHVEAYPLFYRGGAFRDLSVFGDFGVGSARIQGRGREDADGGSMSSIGLGVGYDAVRFWKFSLGPAVEYWHQFSQTMTVNSVALEARLTFVGGQKVERASR
jgi:hypothetical protein